MQERSSKKSKKTNSNIATRHTAMGYSYKGHGGKRKNSRTEISEQ